MINRNRCFIILIIFCLYFVCYTIFCCRLGDAMTIRETNGYKAPRHLGDVSADNFLRWCEGVSRACSARGRHRPL
jgi:hypothetical protein